MLIVILPHGSRLSRALHMPRSHWLRSRPLLGALLSRDLGRRVFQLSDSVSKDDPKLGFKLGKDHP